LKKYKTVLNNKIVSFLKKNLVSYLKQTATYVRFVSSVQQNTFDGKHLAKEK